MSTWVYLECHSHDPPIRSERESGQHMYDVPQIRWDLDAWKGTAFDWLANPPGDPFRAATYLFTARHTRCDIRIVTQYGDDVTKP